MERARVLLLSCAPPVIRDICDILYSQLKKMCYLRQLQQTEQVGISKNAIDGHG